MRLSNGEKAPFFGLISNGPAKKNSLIDGFAAGQIASHRPSEVNKGTNNCINSTKDMILNVHIIHTDVDICKQK